MSKKTLTLSISKAAEELGITFGQAYNMVKRGDLVADRDPSAVSGSPAWRVHRTSLKRAPVFPRNVRPTAKQLAKLQPKREAELQRRAEVVLAATKAAKAAKKVAKKATKKTTKKAA